MKLPIFGSLINLTVIQRRHEYYLAISRHEIFGVVMFLLFTDKRTGTDVGDIRNDRYHPGGGGAPMQNRTELRNSVF